METEDSESATGGSASSQAADLDERRWRPRQKLAWALRAFTIVAPLAAAFAVSRAVITEFPRPQGALATVGWFLLLTAIAVATLRVCEKLTRRLIPMTALLQLSLVFPDRAPSRFNTALRAGSGKALERSAQLGTSEKEMGTPQEAAEHIVGLLGALRLHDPLTRGHSERVRAYSDLIGREMGLSEEDAWRLNWAALIHDLGKLDVSPELLNKKGRPTAEEWEELRLHPGASAAYIQGLEDYLGPWALAATQHHERYDGDGYPLGLAGTEISLAGRIVAVADAFDVMTAARSYKKPLPLEQARAELTNNAGTQFDPAAVKAMLAVSVGDLRSRMGPLAVFGNLPAMLHAPMAATASVGATSAAALGTAALLTVAAIAPSAQALDRIDDPRPDAREFATGAAATGGPFSTPALSSPVAPERLVSAAPATEDTPASGDDDSPEPAPATSEAPTTTESRAIPAATPAETPPETSAPPQDAPEETPPSAPPSTVPPTPPPADDPPPPGETYVPPGAPPQPPPTPPTGGSGTKPTTEWDVHEVTAADEATGFIIIDVLANDTDDDGDLDPSSLSVKWGPFNGTTATVVNDGGPRIKYIVGAPIYNGTTYPDTIMYEVCDLTSECSTGWVTIRY